MAEPWIDQAWNRHADDPDGVLAELPGPGVAEAADDAAVEQLLRLAHHVAGAHQGSPEALAAGRQMLARLAALPAADPSARAAARLYDHALALTAGEPPAADLASVEAVRVAALAAANLAERETTRAAALLDQAVQAAQAAALPDADPAVRALAVAGNNIAATLEEQASPDPATQQLMLQAAQVGLEFWRRAGTWLEEERAHYRLALCQARAGDVAAARGHAQACLRIVAGHGEPPLERFFGLEALARAERLAGDTPALAHAVAAAGEAWTLIDPADQGWCRPTLEALRAMVPAEGRPPAPSAAAG